MTGVDSSPALATCETSQVLLAGVSGDFPGELPFRPTYRLARLDMSEIILKGGLNRIKKNNNNNCICYAKIFNFNIFKYSNLKGVISLDFIFTFFVSHIMLH